MVIFLNIYDRYEKENDKKLPNDRGYSKKTQDKGEEPLKKLNGTHNNMSKRCDKFQEILLVKEKLLNDVGDYISRKIKKDKYLKQKSLS